MNEVTYQAMVPVVDGVTETQFIALVAGKCIGRVGVRVDEDNASIRQLWVEPEFRRQGIGAELMRRCHGLAEKAECECAYLSAMGKDAVKWYQKMGYRVYDRSAVGFHLMKAFTGEELPAEEPTGNEF